MKIILLTYINRSGSTYLANLLSASDEICVCPEGDILVRLFLESPGGKFQFDKTWRKRLIKFITTDSKLKYWGIGSDIFSGLEKVDKNIGAFLIFLQYYKARQKPGATYILFKAERLVDLIYAIEDNKRSGITFIYLFIIRDPRGIYASQKRTLIHGKDRPMSSNPVFTAIFWNHYIGRILKYRKHLSCHQILYKEFIENLDGTLFELSAHLALDLKNITPEKGDLLQRLPKGYQRIHQTLLKMPQKAKIEEWKQELNHEEISLIERKCKKYFSEFGLVPSKVDQNKMVITCKIVYYTLAYRAVRLPQKMGFHLKRIFSLT